MIKLLGQLLKNSPENYGYLNATLRARSSSFLTMNDYISISKGDLGDLEQFLLDSRYGLSYREQLAITRQALLGRIENAIANGACLELLHIKELAKGEPLILLEIIFARADMLNSRLILRALSTGTVSGPSPRWHSYGSLSGSFYNDLWKDSPSLVGIMERCYSKGHPFAVALADSLLDLQNGFDLQKAERTMLLGMLDQLWKTLSHLSTSNSQLVRNLLGMTIDTWNIGIWLRQRTGYPVSDRTGQLFIDKGLSFNPDKLSRSKAMADLVHGTLWRTALRGIEGQTPQDFQRALNIYMWKWQMKLFRSNPLGIEVAMGYMARQLVEWENLNLLSVGLAMNLPSEELIARLIPV